MSHPVLILVAGGSASGKSTVVKEILEKAGLEEVLIIKHDDYYLDQTEIDEALRAEINYDHPSSLDNQRLYEDLKKLLSNEGISKPIYDFVTYNRVAYEKVLPKKVIIVEGILVLEDAKIRSLASISIFVELDDDLRFIRRLERDIKERGRTLDSVVNQYLKTVKPMYHKYIKPSKRFADVIIPNNDKHQIAVDILAARIKEIVGGSI